MTAQIIILNVGPFEPDGSFSVGGVFWLVPANNFIALPNLVSQVPFIDPIDLGLLQTGQLVEQLFNSGLFPSGTTLPTVESYLQSLYSTAQSTLTSDAFPISGVVGLIYDSVNGWTSSTPFIPISPILSVGTLGALNAAVQVSITNQQSVGVQIAAGTFIGDILAETSFDDGNTWNQTYFSQVGSGNKNSVIGYASANTAVAYTIVMNGGVNAVRIRAFAYTSGSCGVTLRASDISDQTLELFTASPGSSNPPSLDIVGAYVTTASPTYTTDLSNALSLNTSGGLRADVTQVGGVSVAAVAKGTQASNAMGVQDFKDSGRNPTIFMCSAATGATAETLLTLTPIRGTTVGSTGTTFAVTSGKTLRLQQLTLTVRNTSTVASGAMIRVRMLAGAVLVGSPQYFSGGATVLGALAGQAATTTMDIPDGWEISGTTQIGISQICSATTCTVDVALIGFEY